MKNACILNYDTLSVGAEHKVYLLVKVEGPPEESGREPLPINLSVVIDRSGSMGGNKLEYVKKAARELVRRLGPKDRLSLVAYDDQVQTPVRPRLVDDKRLFEKAIDDLRTGGTTNLSGGWLQGCAFVGANLSDRGVNRVLLLTDGLANVGVTEPSRLEAMARAKRAEGISTTCFGVGAGFNEDLLRRMAADGGGAFYFIDSPDQAPIFFAEELTDLYNVVGQNLSVRIETESAVRELTQLYDFPHQADQGALIYQLGDLYAEEERHQVLELTLGKLQEGKTRLGQITINYDAVQGESVERIQQTHEVFIQAVPEGELEVSLPVVEVEKIALIQKARQARERAVELADQREFKPARDLLQGMVEEIESSGIKDEALMDLADQLREEAQDMEFGEERYDSMNRKVLFQKASSSLRSDRYDDLVRDQHRRLSGSRMARERSGPAPKMIRWRAGELKLEGKRISIGSAPINDLVLTVEGVAPEHCRLERVNGDWYLRDLAGDVLSPTLANAGMLADGRFRLSAGDVIRVGPVLLRLE